MKTTFLQLKAIFMLLAVPVLAFTQTTGIIKGHITTPDNKGLELINVSLKGTNKGAITNNKGDYQLNAVQPGDYTLVVSGIGYRTATRAISVAAGRTQEVNLTLTEAQQQLQSVEITGRKERTYKTKSTFIGNKTETDLKNLPASVSYASKELMADQGVVRVGEVVKNFSGVNQFTFYDDLTIRGFRVNGQSNTQLVNGLRTSTGFWKQSLTNYLERVEVLKGPSSALYGNASPGGVVNRVTKKPLDETRRSVSLQLGSYNTFRGLADFTGPANKDSSLLYRLNLGYEDANSFRDLQFDKNVIVAPSLTFVASPKTRINFDLVYNSSNSRLDRGQSVIGDNLYSTPQSLSLSAGNDYLREKTYIITLSGNHRFNDNLSFIAGYSKTGYDEDLYEHRSANAYAITSTGAASPNLVAMQIFSRKRKRYIDNLTAYFNYKVNTGIIEHNIVAGYDYGSEKTPVGASQLQAGGYLNKGKTKAIQFRQDLFKEQGQAYIDNNFSVSEGLLIPNVRSFDLNDPLRSQQIQDDSKALFAPGTIAPAYYYLNAGYVQDQLRIGKLQALLGIRYEYYTDFDQYATAKQSKTHSKAWLPRLGLVYNANSNINLYGTYVQGYNPQTASTLANPNANPDPSNPFKPLTSNMVEFGAKTSWFNDMLNITTAVYRIEQNNTLYSIGNDQYRQIGKERAKGIEFDVTGRITSNWSVLVAYAYNDAQIVESLIPEEIGRQKPNAPHSSANAWSRYNVTKGVFKGLGLGGGVYYVDKRNLSINLSQTIPAYTLVNAAVYYTIAKMQLQFNANNITNKKHWVGGYDYIRLFPGTPSNYLFTVNYSF